MKIYAICSDGEYFCSQVYNYPKGPLLFASVKQAREFGAQDDGQIFFQRDPLWGWFWTDAQIVEIDFAHLIEQLIERSLYFYIKLKNGNIGYCDPSTPLRDYEWARVIQGGISPEKLYTETNTHLSPMSIKTLSDSITDMMNYYNRTITGHRYSPPQAVKESYD